MTPQEKRAAILDLRNRIGDLLDVDERGFNLIEDQGDLFITINGQEFLIQVSHVGSMAN